MQKIISELIKAIEIRTSQARLNCNQCKVSEDFEIIVTYELYKLITCMFWSTHNPPGDAFMGHIIRVTADLDGFSFWLADRRDIKNESFD